MNATDPIPPHCGPWEKLGQTSVQIVGHVAALGVAAFLIISWLLTAPIFHAVDYLRARFHSKADREIHPQTWPGR